MCNDREPRPARKHFKRIEQEPSQEFLRVFCERVTVQGPWAETCSFCGAMYEVSDTEDLDTYIVDNRVWPAGCSCNGPTMYQRFLDATRDDCLAYFLAVAADSYRDSRAALQKIAKIKQLPRDISFDLD